MTIDKILNIIHKTIYQFFDVCDGEAPMSDKDKLLLKVNKAICNNLKTLEQTDVTDICVGELISRQAGIEALEQIRYALWEIDIPSPTVPEYIEHHEQVQSVMKRIDEIREKMERLPSVEPEKCGDCISRSEAIRVASGYCHPSNVPSELSKLPSVEPELATNLQPTCNQLASDCISRDAVIGLKTIAPIAPVMNGEAVHYEEVVFVRDLEKLPSVKPERKLMEWKYTTHYGKPYRVCPQCGAERLNDHSTGWNYCPCCGVGMMEVQNEKEESN